MNWSGKEIKKQAKGLVRSDYWHLWFVSTVVVILSYITVISFMLNSMQELPETAKNLTEKIKTGDREQILAVVMVLAVGVFLLNALIQACVGIFMKNPMIVGAKRMFMEIHTNENHQGKVMNLLYVFDHGYRNAIWVMFVRDVQVLVGLVLLVVPGIWRMYCYRMVPYLLAETPELPVEEAFAQSVEMMKGQKWKTFLYDLSFLPWHILGLATFGVVQMFWVHPYKNLSDAKLFMELKANQEMKMMEDK